MLPPLVDAGLLEHAFQALVAVDGRRAGPHLGHARVRCLANDGEQLLQPGARDPKAPLAAKRGRVATVGATELDEARIATTHATFGWGSEREAAARAGRQVHGAGWNRAAGGQNLLVGSARKLELADAFPDVGDERLPCRGRDLRGLAM